MQTIIKTFFIGLVAVLGLAGCGGGGSSSSSSSSGTNDAQSAMSLTQVAQLMVAPSGLTQSRAYRLTQSLADAVYAVLGIRSAVAQSSGTTYKAYSIDSTGSITDTNIARLIAGASTTASSNWAIETRNFVIFSFDGLYQPTSSGSRQCVLVGVRKSDGKFACISANPRCDTVNACNVNNYRSQIKESPDGNKLYIVLGDGGLEWVDLTDPANVVSTSIFTHAAVGDAGNPMVNQVDDVFTSVNLGSTNSVEYRVYSRQGGLLHTLSDSSPSCAFPGTGTDGSFYYSYVDPAITGIAPNGTAYVKKITNSGTAYVASTVYSVANASNVYLGAGCVNVVQMQGQVYATNWYNSGNPTYQAPLYLTRYPLTPSDSIAYFPLESTTPVKKDMQAHTNGMVILGETTDGTSSSIERFDLSVATTVIPSGRYKINQMAVSSDGSIKFVGTRLSDSAAVVVTMTPTDVTTVATVSAQPVSIVSLAN